METKDRLTGDKRHKSELKSRLFLQDVGQERKGESKQGARGGKGGQDRLFYFILFFYKFICFYIWLRWVFVAAR